MSTKIDATGINHDSRYRRDDGGRFAAPAGLGPLVKVCDGCRRIRRRERVQEGRFVVPGAFTEWSACDCPVSSPEAP